MKIFDHMEYHVMKNNRSKRGGPSMSAEEVLQFLIDEGLNSLEDLNQIELNGDLTPFQFGLRTATVAYMEIIQRWEKAEENGLDFDIEDEFPV